MPIAIGKVITKDHLEDVLKSINSLVKEQTLVGIPADHAARHEEGEPINNAAIGYIEEFGSPANNIPARPSLIPGVEAAKPEIIKQLRKGVDGALEGRLDAGEKALHRAGIVAVNSVRAKINEGIPPPLAPATIAARKRRGRTGTKPLIDTGQFRNAITYVLRKVK